MRDFTKFTCFVRGVLETGYVIKHSDKVLRRDVKMHFNRLLHEATQFEKFLKAQLGQDMAEAEDSINSAVVDLVWQIFDMNEAEVQKFFDHINSFNENK
jgi:transcriptional regulator of heat shock response